MRTPSAALAFFVHVALRQEIAMHPHYIVRSVVFCFFLALGLAGTGCNRGPKATVVAESQAQTAQPANQPMTVSGCLKAGEADGTFVLTAARTTGSSGETATYHLVGPQANNLQEHVGRQVEVIGTMQAQQEIASNAPAQPANERATGTSGTVQTRTDIDIRRLAVTSLKPIAEKCEM
jgi:hypothetical protein